MKSRMPETRSKLAVICSHPIQYYAPLFSLLSKQEGLEVLIFYTLDKYSTTYDKGFGKEVEWDIPLLSGYSYLFVANQKFKRKNIYKIWRNGLIEEILEWRASAVLIIGWNYFNHLMAMIYFNQKIPVLFRGDSNLLDEKNIFRTLLRRLVLKWVYKNVDFALYVGEANKQYYLKNGLLPSQLIFAPHAIDNQRFASINVEQNNFVTRIKKEFCIYSECITIVFVGKFIEKKNPLLLMKAVKSVKHMNLHLIMVGNGDLENAIREEASGHPNIHILPFQNQSIMPAVYRLGEIFCLPSQGPGETWGLAVNEAMASGNAILVSDKVGCATDLVNEGVNGYIFRSNEIDDLVMKLKIMLNDLEKLNQMRYASELKIKDWNFAAVVMAIKGLVLT